MHNAANFAFANRLFLGLMLYKSLAEEIREFQYQLLYDAPHNYVWEEKIDGVEGFLHRKGSCTAKSAEQMSATPFYATGEPVMIPGSMGAHSFLLAGKGNRSSLYSASHGAGRQRSRGSSLKVDDALFRDFIERFTIINPIDPKRPDLRNRRDILQKWEDELKKEAPYAYKDITSVIQSHVDYGMADIVAEMEPIFTIKG
ncbi:RNA-splicing ligase RtcB [compost metagenome]